MFKQKGNVNIVNSRNVRTRAHDAILYTTVKPNNDKYKRNVLYKGALAWNNLPAIERNIENYENLKKTFRRGRCPNIWSCHKYSIIRL